MAILQTARATARATHRANLRRQITLDVVVFRILAVLALVFAAGAALATQWWWVAGSTAGALIAVAYAQVTVWANRRQARGDTT